MADDACYHLGSCRLLPAQRRVLDPAGQSLRLGGRAFDMLLALVERRERTVGKGELLELVWPHLVVEENNLQVQVLALRRLLGADAIATVPGRGYRFTLPVRVEGPAPAAPAEPPPVAPGPAVLHGRDADLHALAALLQAQALVTVAGAGGIGKTRLAQAALARHGGPVAWVDLAALADPAAVPAAVAHALGAPSGTHADDATAAAVQALCAAPRLLVLDNAEHVLPAVAALAGALLAGVAKPRLLVTSQELLRVPQEHVLRLEPLSLPAAPGLAAAAASGAVALFVERAKAANHRFVLDERNLPAVTELCRRLDGIPLAIELAAARTPLLGAAGVLARLDERFRLLTAGARNALPRQQTLRATLDWSHALLDDGERRLLRRLGVFVDGFTMEAAQRVTATDGDADWQVLDRLGTLVDKSLVVAQGQPVPRYRLLETTRLYALEQLAAAGETAATQRRHAQWLADWALQRDDDARRWRSSHAEQRALAAEVANARAALQWAAACTDDALAMAVGAGMHYVFNYAGRNDEYLALARALYGRADTRLPHTPLFWLRVANACANPAHAEGGAAAQQAATQYRARGDAQRLYEALSYAIAIEAGRADDGALQAWADEARSLEQPQWPPSLRGNLQWALHRWLRRRGRHAEALEATRLQAALARERDTGYDQVLLGANAASLLVRLGRLDEAEALSREALAALQARGIDDFRTGFVHGALAEALVRQGRAREALPIAQRAFALLEPNGDGRSQALVLAEIGAALGHPAHAACALAHVAPADGHLHERVAQLCAALAAALGAPAFEAAQATGARLPLRAALQALLDLA